MTTTARIIEKKDVRILVRLWNFVMGRRKPPFLTRAILLGAFAVFLYYFGWNIFRYLAITFIDSLDNPEDIKANLQAIGDPYGIDDALNTFPIYFLAIAGAQVLVLTSFVFIYRRKIWGYLLFFAGQGATLLAPLVIIGTDYFYQEIDIVDKVLPILISTVFMFSMFRLKNIRTKEKEERIFKQQQ